MDIQRLIKVIEWDSGHSSLQASLDIAVGDVDHCRGFTTVATHVFSMTYRSIWMAITVDVRDQVWAAHREQMNEK